MRRAARVDSNQAEIVSALVAAGASVESLANVGHGVPDLMVARAGKMMLMEVKDGSLSPSRRNLRSQQEEWHAQWRGPIAVVTDVEGALRALRVMNSGDAG